MFLALSLLVGYASAQNPIEYCVENDITHAYLNDFSYDTVSLEVSYVMDYFKMQHDYRLDAPKPVRLSWVHQAGAEAQRVEVSENQNYSDAITFTIDKDTAQYDLYNMIPGRKYYYRIVSVIGTNETTVSEGQLEPNGMLRWILAQGTWNVRDMGGWIGLGGHPIKYGLIFRGAQLVSPKSPYPVLITESGKEAMRNAGIRAELDLRSASQAPGTVSSLSVNGDVDYLVVPESSGARMCNFDKTEVTIRELQWIIDELRAGKPVFYHCQNGADRTGTMGFLIGALLGMGESDLAKDYELTTFCEVDAAKFDPTEAGFARLRNYEGKKGSPIGYGDNADEYKYAKLVEKMRTVTPTNANYQRKIYNWFLTGKNGVKISEEDLAWFIKEMVDYVMVKEIKWDGGTSLNLTAGQSHSLNVSIVPADASNKTTVYKSSDEAVATVSDDGVITAVRGGSAKVTIQVDDLVKTIDVTVPTIESQIPAYALYNNVSCPVTNDTRTVNGSFEYIDAYYSWTNGAGTKLSDAGFELKSYEQGGMARYIESKLDGDATSEGSIVTEWKMSKNTWYVFGYKVKNSTDLVSENNANLKALLTVKNAANEDGATILDAPSYDGQWKEVQYVFNSGDYNRLKIVFTHLSQNGNNTCLDNFYISVIDVSADVKAINPSYKGEVYDVNSHIRIIDGKKYLIR